jgi:hypothetical protein
MSTSIYKLQPIVDDPRYEGFAVSKLPDDLPETIHTKDWRPRRLSGTWVAPLGRGRVREFNDFPGINLGEPAFSEKAVQILADFLEPNGEILPIKTNTKGRYFYYNVLTVVDVLDRNSSTVTWTTRGVMARSIDHFVFRTECIVGLSIFRIIEVPTSKFVTQSFVDRVQEHDLKGFNFIKVWPLPEGTHWDPLVRSNQRPTKQVESAKPAIKNHSVIICLRLGAEHKVTKSHLKRVERLMNEAENLLADGAQNHQDVGGLEGHECVGSEMRLFFACPSAEELATRLLPWLKQIDWSDGLYAIKRQGPFADAKASESIFYQR